MDKSDAARSRKAFLLLTISKNLVQYVLLPLLLLRFLARPISDAVRISDSSAFRISIFSAAFTAKARAHDITVLGSGTAGPTIINIDYLAFKVDLEGKQVGIYRGVDKSVKIRISNSQTTGNIITTLGIPKHAADMDFKVNNSSVALDINGHMMTGDRV